MVTNNNPLELEFFRNKGFIRKKCTECGMYYWTVDGGRTTCGDPPCDEYTFIGNPPVKNKFTLDQMRKEFIDFFRDGHTFLRPYPVVPRWRDDVLLVNASIYDFQPQVTSGVVKPPANPIVMSQPSIRMIDVDLVGTTGRHLTTFEMMCHDSFNYPETSIYWKEETVEYCNSFLTGTLGVPQSLITYKEKPWSGGGNGGNSFEVLVSGLEVATLVFMDMKVDPDGTTEIDGLKYSPMKMKIIDTGYGLERLTWLSQGTPTIYEAIYPEIVSHVIRNSDANLIDHRVQELVVKNFVKYEGKPESEIIKLIIPQISEIGLEINDEEFVREFHTLRSAFVIADHARTLLLLFSDYVIPSNIKAGYLVRLLIRRSLRNIESIHYQGDIIGLIEMHWESLKNIITSFPKEFAALMLEDENRKYAETLQRGRGIVERLVAKKNEIGREELIKLYDSNGLHPDFVSSVVEEITGKPIDVPEDFHMNVVSLHDTGPQIRKEQEKFPEIVTRPLYYDDVNISDFNAVVLHSGKDYIITNQTAFYPEGGGQPSDLGHFIAKGKKVNVRKVERFGDTIVHWIDGTIPEGTRIMGHIDKVRRGRLMVHHTATHLILGVMKEILGPHVWQSGVQKGVVSSRIDITHYKKLTEEEVNKIERRCLEYIREARPVRVKNIDWNKAIEKYGFTLFQGGVPLSPKLRVVEIEGVDVEGCGGTHVSSTHELGFVKVVNTESIQEGIQRITFTAGDAALDFAQQMQDSIRKIQAYAPAEIKDLPVRISSLVKENIELTKGKDEILKKQVNAALESATVLEYQWGSVLLVASDLGREGLRLLSTALFSRNIRAAFVKNRNAGGDYTYSLISKGLKEALPVMKKILGKESDIEGKGNYLTSSSQRNLDEKLIKTIFDEIKLERS